MRNRSGILLVTLLLAVTAASACTDDAFGPAPEELGITTTSTTTTAATTTTTMTVPPTTSTSADVDPIRITAGDLPPTRYATDEFLYGLEFRLPNGTWSTDAETRTSIHLAQSPYPDFAAAASYDYPLLVLLALPELDEAAVLEELTTYDDIGFTAIVEGTVGERPAISTDGASRGNPVVTPFVADDGTLFAGLGGYWFWDPDIAAVLYRTWIVDMGRGTLVAWYAAPRDRFAAGAAAASAVVESIVFTD